MKTEEIKSYLIKKETTDGLIERFYIKLENSDSVSTNYVVTDYYNSSRTEIVDTIIEKIGNYEHADQVPAEVDTYISKDSYIGKKILEFIVDGGVSFEEAHPIV